MSLCLLTPCLPYCRVAKQYSEGQICYIVLANYTAWRRYGPETREDIVCHLVRRNDGFISASQHFLVFSFFFFSPSMVCSKFLFAGMANTTICPRSYTFRGLWLQMRSSCEISLQIRNDRSSSLRNVPSSRRVSKVALAARMPRTRDYKAVVNISELL